MTVSSRSLSGASTPTRSRGGGFITQEVVLALTVVGISLIVGLVNNRFLAQQNVFDILSNSSYIAVAAIGMSMVIISGNIDISVGSLIGLLATISGTIAVNAEASGYPLWLAFVAPLIGGMLAGAINGFLVAYLRIPAIVVSLGMLSILKGGLILWTGGEWIYNLPPAYQIAQQKIIGLPVPIYLMVILTILGALWLRYSATGRAIYAIGGNKEAARLSGISERSVIMQVFIINGLMVGVASIMFATQFNAIQSTVPSGLELLIITAAVVGGVSILGGTGTVIGAALGAVVFHVIPSAMVFLSISPYWKQAVQGLLILITVLIDLYRRRRQAFVGMK
ncbi:MAG: ABC transporter permease [Chitinophagaceae bacterium]|nr:ABC transporter permease [Anaerolineae bacterium]